jgi:hypothetical protein
MAGTSRRQESLSALQWFSMWRLLIRALQKILARARNLLRVAHTVDSLFSMNDRQGKQPRKSLKSGILCIKPV